MCGGKFFSWVGEKNTFLKKLVVRWLAAFFKSVFFCVRAFLFIMLKVFPISFSTFPNPSFLLFEGQEIFGCGRGGLGDTTHE